MGTDSRLLFLGRMGSIYANVEASEARGAIGTTLRDNEFSPTLSTLSFGASFYYRVDQVVEPVYLERLSFANSFNQPAAEILWSAGLEQPSIGDSFTQPIDGSTWPASLQQLSFGAAFSLSSK